MLSASARRASTSRSSNRWGGMVPMLVQSWPRTARTRSFRATTEDGSQKPSRLSSPAGTKRRGRAKPASEKARVSAEVPLLCIPRTTMAVRRVAAWSEQPLLFPEIRSSGTPVPSLLFRTDHAAWPRMPLWMAFDPRQRLSASPLRSLRRGIQEAPRLSLPPLVAASLRSSHLRNGICKRLLVSGRNDTTMPCQQAPTFAAKQIDANNSILMG